MIRFVHAADLHLDSPMRGLERYEGAPSEQIRGASRRAMENLVALCRDEQVDFLLLAGDLYDGDWPDYSTGLFFSRQMSALREAGIKVYLVSGNHDAANRITKHLQLPSNVRELSIRRPETIVLEELGVAIHGQGFATRAVTEDLAARYPEPIQGAFNIGMVHTCLDGREGHDPYAPSSIPVLVDKGYDYWALGHIHAREIVRADPWIVFPGNLQGRHARETGAKGASLVTVDDGRVQDVAHRSLDVVRWRQVEVDASEARDGSEMIELVRAAIDAAASESEGRLLAARVTITGRSRAHEMLHKDREGWQSQLHATAADAAGDRVWVEKLILATTAHVDPAELRSRDDALGQLARGIHELRHTGQGLDALATHLAELHAKLPKPAKEGPDALRLDDPEFLRALLGDVEDMLLSRLASMGDE